MFNISHGRKIASAAIVATLGLSLVACSGGGTTEPGGEKAAELEKVTFMTDVAFLPKHAPFFSAMEQGFFEREGIDLEIMPGSGSNNTVVAVETNKIKFGWADFAVTTLNRARGAQVKQVALVQGGDAYAAVTLPESGIKTFKDLKGKRVATEGAGAMTSMWPLALEKSGLKKSDVEVIHAAGEAKIPGLLSGQWDATLALFVSDGPVLVGLGYEPVLLKWRDIGISLYGNGIVASESTMKDNPDLVKRFTKAMTQGFVHACANQDQAGKDLMKNVVGLKEEAVKMATAGQCDLMWSDENKKLGYGAMSDEGVQTVIDIAGKYLGLKDADKLKASDVYTNKFTTPIPHGTVIESAKK
jgi:NitT/TauT family transport system substrate-binding protein